ncbi:hypothetical protein DPMN_146139 [Dreissena polymorpha]|uniref:C-type lectin domain-containing protein n=1 Tax=Dreissena polymorpha TaxID=45954 RepID=A0A9D4F6H0_DREPO|nr:hypothetical protein DPMN_146139 [Dreissena polymorpha]
MAISIEQVWIGIHLKDGSWISSIDDQLVAKFNWALDEPNNQDNMEHCAITDIRVEWRRLDVPCTTEICAVCEIDM